MDGADDRGRRRDRGARRSSPTPTTCARWRRRRSAIPIARRAFAALSATAAIESGSPTALRQADYARAISLAADDPARALALFDRSVERGESVGNRWIRAFALTESLWIRAQQGDPLGALAGYRDVIDTWFRGSDWANLWLSLRYVAAILESLERDEAAAVLYGALEAAGAVAALPLEPSSADEFALVVKRVTERLDPTVLADAVERGRTLGDDEVVRYALAGARRASRQRRRGRSVSAAVHENSGAPWPAPVVGEKYSAKPCSSTSASVRSRRSSASSWRSAVARAPRRSPSWCSPRWGRPSSGAPGSGGPRAGRSAPGTPASRPPDPAAGRRARRRGSPVVSSGRKVATVRSLIGCVGHRVAGAVLVRRCVPEQLERVGLRVDERIEVADVADERAQRLVGGGEERVERDVFHEHGAVVVRDAREVEVVVREVDREREHAQAVVVGRALAGGEVARVVAQ